MRQTSWRVAIIAALCAVLLPWAGIAMEEPSGPARGNLLLNPSFEDVQNGEPASWTQDMWIYEAGVSYVELREGGRGGTGFCAMVENVSNNDARLMQTVQVEPDTDYRLSGWVKAENCDPQGGGANLSVRDSFAVFPRVYDTDGEWVYLECYLRTDAEQDTLSIAARLGGYSADTTGKAWFDDLSLEVVDEVPAGAELIRLVERTAYAFPELEEAQTEPPSRPTAVPWSLLFMLLVLGLWALRGFGIPYAKPMAWLLLALAAVLRLWLMATQVGYETDMACFFNWSQGMVNYGPGAFYESIPFCDYPPGYMYLLWVTGKALRLLSITDLNTEAARLVVKSMPLLADMAALCVIWRSAQKRFGDSSALLIMALYAFSPAVLINGAVWGQVDAVLAFGLMATVALASGGKWRWALPMFAVTVLMKPQALMAGPIGVAALCLPLLNRETRGKTARDALLGLLYAVAVAAALLLPFLMTKAEPLEWLVGQYSGTLGSYAYATVNAANLYYLLGLNWVALDVAVLGQVTYGQLGTALMALALLLVLWLFLRRRSVEDLPFFCALTFIALYMFGVKMHERYLFPALALLLIAYIRRRDGRYLLLFAGFSLTLFGNCFMVLRDTHLQLGHGFAGTALSVFNCLLTGVAIWVAWERRALPLPVLPLPKRVPVDRLAALAEKTPRNTKMRRLDWVLIGGLTAVYAMIAYTNLGSATAPQTEWISTGASEEVVFDLGEAQTFTMMYYGGITTRNFSIEFSEDGEGWSESLLAEMGLGECFRWKMLTPEVYDGNENRTKVPMASAARYVRMMANGPSLSLMEVAFRGTDGSLLPIVSVTGSGARDGGAYDVKLLIDEQGTVPDQPSFYNSTYFDEIYHARTGYEHAHGLTTYEWTHPPLGKVFIMLGIQLFGMTAFGWRFMGALAGVLMVPAMYMLGKLLFRRRRYAFTAAFVMAFDMMHLTQTRIATIDSFAVLFIILMYLCMLRYLQMSIFRDGWKTLIPLGFSGLFMGLGCASKWICIYAGIGLALLFFWSLWQRYREYVAARDLQGGLPDQVMRRVLEFPRYALGTLSACIVFFIAIPALIYYYSYIPHFAWQGGLTWQRFIDTQVSMFSYHANLVDNHAFKSPWYEWPLILKPMYYYNGKPYVEQGNISTIMAMGNPAVWWVGLAALIYVGWQWLRPHMRGVAVRDSRPAMLLIAFAAQFVPWMLVPRSMFIYHYFGSLPFVMLCIVYAFERWYAAKPWGARVALPLYWAVVLLLFIGFYPLATGTQVPEALGNWMNWLGFLKLPGWQYRGWLYF